MIFLGLRQKARQWGSEGMVKGYIILLYKITRMETIKLVLQTESQNG